MRKTIAITGANGFIGNAMVKAFHAKGYKVKALVHHEPSIKIEDVDYAFFSIEKEPSTELFSGVDVLIHLAFQFKPAMVDGEDANMRAIKFLKELNLPRYVFMSSFAAADPVTASYYGLSKKQAENFFTDEIIIRPALVLGNGGLFGRMKTQLQKSRFVPLLKGGNQIMQTIFIDDLVTAVIALVEQDALGIHQLAYPDKILYKDLIKQMANQINRPVSFVPVPVALMQLVIMAFQILPKPPFSKDNLVGLLASKYIDTAHEYKSMGCTWLSASESLERLA
jgi:nucleoside-diphosphate-sugar epimerase